jgi:MoaA/NifB/PqqE/SkfB family radical SAM enzyme
MEKSKIDYDILYSIYADVEAGIGVSESCKRHNIPDTNFLAWIKQYSELTNHSGILLYYFFENLTNLLKLNNFFCINLSINESTNGSFTYDKNKCERWFKEKTSGEKTELFGSYFDFGDVNFLFYIGVGSLNLHIGIVKYKLVEEKYELQKMNNRDFKHVIKKFGTGLPRSIKLEKRGWGNVWCSVDCGNFSNLANSATMHAMADFGNSVLFRDKLKPLLSRIDDIKNNRNNAFLYSPSILNFRVSYKCNLKCKHCYNSSSNIEQGHINKDTALRVIDEAYACGIRTLGITGGEPTLFPDIIFDMMSQAARLGYKNITMVTNASWGKTLKKAKNLLQKMYALGIKPPISNLAISAGQFHHEFLDWSYHKNVITAHHQVMGTKIRVDFEYAPGHSILLDEFINFLKDNGVNSEWYKLGVRTSLASVGRWKDNQEAYSTPMIPVEDLGSCEPVEWFTVDPNGDVFPCCGFNKEISGLVLGNVNCQSVSDIIQSRNTHIPFIYLYNMHFHEIHKKLANHIVLPEKFTSQCEACESIFKDKNNIEYLKGELNV